MNQKIPDIIKSVDEVIKYGTPEERKKLAKQIWALREKDTGLPQHNLIIYGLTPIELSLAQEALKNTLGIYSMKIEDIKPTEEV